MRVPKKIILSASLIIFAFTATRAQQPSVNSVSFGSGAMVSRAPDVRGWTDPALNHNKLIQQRTAEGTYKLIGPYKVVGTQFLYGEHHKADMFATEAKAYNIYISYNTYNQEVEFYSSSNPDQPLVKSPGEVDSFTIHPNLALDINSELKFVYGKHLGTGDKSYYQEVYKGEKYSLYKRYKSELGFVSNNYATNDLRQFDLTYDYYYYDSEKKTLKKLKSSYANVLKEFKDVKDITAYVSSDEFDVNKEAALRKVFGQLNSSRGF